MKYFIVILLLLLSGSISAQNPNDSILDIRNQLMKKAEESVLTESETKHLVNIAFALQNKGFELGDYKNDYSGSLAFIDSAIPVWVALEDTSMEANLYKYKGVLLGKLHRFDEAKSIIDKAMRMYAKIHQPFGVAVSRFDLAMVYDVENKTDSALLNTSKALEYWESVSEKSRIFLVKNYLIYLNLKAGDQNKAIEFQIQNEAIIKTTELNDFFLMDYYYVASLLNEKLGKVDLKKQYFELYQQLSSKTGIDLHQKYHL